jgi:hypothetical protein
MLFIVSHQMLRLARQRRCAAHHGGLLLLLHTKLRPSLLHWQILKNCTTTFVIISYSLLTSFTSVLVYPPSGPGALNIMGSDLNRLRPHEFLNDTLIEFGLK